VSIHIGSNQGLIAPTVLLPGDPFRAKYIAETMLEDVFCHNNVCGSITFGSQVHNMKTYNRE